MVSRVTVLVHCWRCKQHTAVEASSGAIAVTRSSGASLSGWGGLDAYSVIVYRPLGKRHTIGKQRDGGGTMNCPAYQILVRFQGKR